MRKPKKFKVKVGNVVRLTIIDHCMPGDLGRQQNLTFQVYGIVLRIKGDFLTLASWCNVEDVFDPNNEGFEIVISAIKEVKLYE